MHFLLLLHINQEPVDEKYLSAYEALFNTYYASLCQSAAYILRDTALSEDVVQSVFIKVWQHRKQFESESHQKNYLKRAVYNASLNMLEKEQRRSSAGDFDAIVAQTKDETTTEGIIEGKEMEAQIEEILASLPPQCKLVFSMSRYDGLSYKEIATLLEVSVKMVEKQMSKALKRFRENLTIIN